MNPITQGCAAFAVLTVKPFKFYGQYRAAILKTEKIMTGIYIITNKVSGNTYVGQSIDIKRRFIEHRTITAEHNQSLKRAFIKYGLENFSFEVLEECSAEMLNEREMFFIEKLKPRYNRTKGGDGRCRPLTEEEKEHLRACGKRQWAAMSQEARLKQISNNLKGPKVGHPVSKETREKLRVSILGKKAAPETVAKRQKAIRCIETGEIFQSIKEAQEKKHLPSSLCQHLKGRTKTCNGLHFEYLSVETTRDECSGVGQRMSCCPKCAAHENV